MPLILLESNLKNLRFGQDRPGGGSSGQPYVQFEAPSSTHPTLPEPVPPDQLEFYQNNRSNLDFPIRGGNFDLSLEGPYVSLAAKYDKIRIEKFLKDSPRGPIFLLKQIALQLSNPKIQVGAQVNLNLGSLPFRYFGQIENTRIYNNGVNTLLQVGVQGSGFHYDRHGLVPVNPFQQTYRYVVNDNNNPLTVGGVPKGNRLYNLWQTKILSSGRVALNTQTVNVRTLDDLGISRNPDLLIQYPGGPTSVGGIGFTTIHRRDNTVGDFNQKLSVAPDNSYIQTFTSQTQIVSPTGQQLTVSQAKDGPLPQPLRPISPQPGKAQPPQFTRKTLRDLYESELFRDPSTVSNPPTPAGQPVIILNLVGLPITAVTVGGRIFEIRRTVDTSDSTNNKVTGTTRGTTHTNNLNYSYTYQLLNAEYSGTIANPAPVHGPNQAIKADFRAKIKAAAAAGTASYPKNAASLASSTYGNTTTLIGKYGTGNPGSSLLDRSNITNTDPATQDTVNTGATATDLITFLFEPLSASGGTLQTIRFRAFLTDITDNNSAKYSDYKYTGRGESFYTYDGFTRSVSFKFTVAAQSKAEIIPLYLRTNYLISQIYPDYNITTGWMRMPIQKLTIGTYIVKQPCLLNSVNVSIPDESPWDIDLEKPHILNVSCNATILHKFLPRRNTTLTGVTYIGA